MLQRFFIAIWEYITIHKDVIESVVISGIITAILSVIFDFKKHIINIKVKLKKTIISQTILKSFNFFSHNTKITINELNNFNKNDFRQEINSISIVDLISSEQLLISTQIKNIIRATQQSIFDPQQIYESAIKEMHRKNYSAAHVYYCQLFKRIILISETLAIYKEAQIKMDNLKSAVERLIGMINIQSQTKITKFIKQVAVCDKAILALLLIIYDVSYDSN